MGRLHNLLARLDEDQVRRGRQFERVCKWFVTNDPLYQHQVRRVWLWDEWPGRRAADAGIDLVVEDREGRLWAVQAKAYDPTYSVTKADMDTFLSNSPAASAACAMVGPRVSVSHRASQRASPGMTSGSLGERLNAP